MPTDHVLEAGPDRIEPEAIPPGGNEGNGEIEDDAPAPRQRMRFSFEGDSLDGDSNESGRVS